MSTPTSASHWRRSVSRFTSDRYALFGLGFLALVMLLAIAAPLLTSHEPNFQDLDKPFAGLSSDHWLGTDSLGRDTFSRLIHGARPTLLASVAVTFFATVIAVPLGLISGYWSGKVDMLIMRVVDALLAVPPLALALAVAGTLGPGNRNLIIALVVVFVPSFVRLVRGSTLAVREEGYVDASRAIGTPSPVILWRRVFPHVLSPLLVNVSIALGSVLILEATLSYLGLGTQPPNPSWGSMLRSGFETMASDARLMLVPAITISLTSLAFNVVGDGVRDALTGGTPLKRRRGDKLGLTTVLSPAPAPVIGEGSDTILSIRNLGVQFDTPAGPAQVLDDVNIELKRGEILGLVGESGCGKTVTSMSVLRLLPSPPARITSGSVLFEGRDLLQLDLKELRAVRGNDIAMVFQDPMASLNPAFTVGDQLVEAQLLHSKLSKSHARTWAAELLDRVGIPEARKRLDDFPHTFSGGMRQRVLIAMALANYPKVLIADEPTTALDVTVQAQIIELIRNLRDEFDMSVIFVTHDLGVVQDICDRVTVMYAGQVVEQATVQELFTSPRHPYSRALLEARPKLGDDIERLRSIPGVVPTALEMPSGCRFQPRCGFATDACAAAPVPLVSAGEGLAARCIHIDQVLATPRTTGPGTPAAVPAPESTADVPADPTGKVG
jgi:peptide/nickel transport system permease protein